MDIPKTPNAKSQPDMSIFHSETVKARQRIYYIDVKRDRNGEYYLCLTESKKSSAQNGDAAQASYEKHKLFLYSEDMKRFSKALAKAVEYIEAQKNASQSPATSWDGPFSPEDLSLPTDVANVSPEVEPSADNYHQNVDF